MAASPDVLGLLEGAGYLTRVREGRRNRYRITPGAKFRHPAEADRDIAELLALFAREPGTAASPRTEPRQV
ncbi:hypothetical protein [Streptomyces sp. NPDC056401]|uniref:hypothetical protein n=1 Tax=Streptomyces sp. NPDC056401 TaxID=3345809 RepID=UPI0035D9CF22